MDLLLLDTAIRAYGQRLSVTDQRIDVNSNSVCRIAYSFLLVCTIHVQPLEGRAIGMERIPIWFNDEGDLKTQLPLSGLAGGTSG